MADIFEIKEKVCSAAAKAGENLKELHTGVALTKAKDLIGKVDLEGRKQQVEDFLDSPKMDEIRSAGRTLKDFLGYVPSYAQSIPGMVRDGIEKLKSKK